MKNINSSHVSHTHIITVGMDLHCNGLDDGWTMATRKSDPGTYRSSLSLGMVARSLTLAVRWIHRVDARVVSWSVLVEMEESPPRWTNVDPP
jgi:hypothetical protein